ncbi:AQJ64_40280 family protein [Streptosporangium sp. NPDC051023]|uniref:AQJ64_40280 family protein n=1 Tax=Streptosporangium sp. NPDC051023 TaxID=3155410 RepID=UPI00344FBB2E
MPETIKQQVEWVDADDALPPEGVGIIGALRGVYPDGTPFRVSLSMYFTKEHHLEDGTVVADCFVDSDRVVRKTYSEQGSDGVTHWCRWPEPPTP